MSSTLARTPLTLTLSLAAAQPTLCAHTVLCLRVWLGCLCTHLCFSLTGSDLAYSQNPNLVLTVGHTYTFYMQNVAAYHPFYISTSAIGDGAGEYLEGVQGTNATVSATSACCYDSLSTTL